MTENKKGTKGKHVLPRISKATGGPLPGIELTDLSTLREIDDLDYIRRMHRPGPPPTEPRGRTALSEVSRWGGSDEPAPLRLARPAPQCLKPQRERCSEPEGKPGMVGDAVTGKRMHQDIQPFAVEH